MKFLRFIDGKIDFLETSWWDYELEIPTRNLKVIDVKLVFYKY